MTKSISSFLAAVLIGGSLLAVPAQSLAAKGDCGQPSSTGTTGPKTSDAQTILKASVGTPTDCDLKSCICDVNSNNKVQVSDAQLVLKKAVGTAGVTLVCTTCTPPKPPCTSAVFESRPGSDLDSGWTGVAHNSDLILGASVSFRTLRRCSITTATTCEKASDCPSGETCKATCNCNDDTSCEVTGPTHPKNCLDTLKSCTTNTDCPNSSCIWAFGPPIPLSSGGTPVCVLSIFDGPLTGTADSSTGTALTTASLKSRVFLGIALDQPCPRCGPPDQAPKLGDAFTCEGGQFPNAVCHVDGTSDVFGGVSFDCPPNLSANISGSGLAIRFNEVTTGTSTKTAQLPCTTIPFNKNPLNPATSPKCIDKTAAGDPVCTSNADCLRCTGDSTITCASNADCGGPKGTCSEAPDQPISCGYWCNCGFCGGNASLPCFQNSDCDGTTCVVGPGTGTAANAPQAKPNDCSQDKFICGGSKTEECKITQVGKCSDQPYRNCTTNTDCSANNAGTCDRTQRPCFGPRITRTGSPSPLGKYCAFENKACTSNTDCAGAGDFCANDASRPETVALFCVPGTQSPSVNSAGGITGPGAVRLNSFLKVCRCGDGIIGCDEKCDDSNTVNGDGCSDLCQPE